MAVNRFAKAKESATPSAKKSDKKIIQITDKKFDSDLSLVAKLRTQMESLKTQLALAEGNLKTQCVGLFIEEYQKNGSYPGSFIIESLSAKMMFVPMDGYKKLTPETFQYLNKKYGEGEVTAEVTKFSMDEKIIQDYGDVISEAIDKIPTSKMSNEVKDKLFVIENNLIVKKGTIEKGLTIGKGVNSKGEVGKGKVSLSDFRDDVDNTNQLKNCELK
jgi:hypothetical protein